MQTPALRFLLPLAASLTLLAAAPTALASPTAAAGTVFATFWKDVNTGNAAAAAALLSPSVKWSAGPAQAYPPKFPLTASGLAGVGALLAQEQADHITLTLVGTPTVNGNTVSFTADLANPTLKTLGVGSVQVDGTATVSGGLITAVRTRDGITYRGLTAVATAGTVRWAPGPNSWCQGRRRRAAGCYVDSRARVEPDVRGAYQAAV